MKKGFVFLITTFLALMPGLNRVVHGATSRASMIGQQDEVIIPLEGLDPVMLAQGKEAQGKMSIFTVRGRYKYLFASEENKAIFEKNPADFEIQLEGICARMGAQIESNPDLFAVYKNRIYLFGSERCQELFRATPDKYLEPVYQEVAATPEISTKGLSIIEKAVAAMGGAAKIDGITSYQEAGLATAISQQGETHFKTVLFRSYPDRVRREQTRPFGTIVTVLSPDGSFGLFQNDRQKNISNIHGLQQAEAEKQMKRLPLEVLRARKQSDFKAAFAGAAKSGESMVEQVDVSFSGVRLRIGVDAATGRIVTLSYVGRNQSTGEVGEIVQSFSDFRAVEGLTLPFKTTGTFNGDVDAQLSYAIESLSLNIKVDPSIFVKPSN